jgi:hypothetical protein
MTTNATTQTPYRMNFTPKFRPMETRVVVRRAEKDFHVPWISILIGLCVGSCLVSALMFYSTPKYVSHCPGPHDGTKNSIKALQSVAEAWRANHANECPTAQRLKEEKELAASSDIVDAWGTPYLIWCTSDATTVVSFGPDKTKGTEDDIAFPPMGVPR